MSEHSPAQPRFDAVLGQLGEPDSRRLVTTPALVCEIDLLDQNITRMQTMGASNGVAIRPHVKSHKSAFIAKRQLDAGAAGLACAKLSEAEAIIGRFDANEDERRVSVLLTSPLAGEAAAARAVALATWCEMIVVADHLDGIDELAKAANEADTELTVLCDVDVGLGRTGAAGPAQALALVERIEQSTRLRFGGVQGYGGHLQHIVGRESRREATRESTQKLADVVTALEARGWAVPLRTGGGTGTSMLDVEIGLLNELQPGSYVFMDREYRDALGDDEEGRFHQSLSIVTTVISTNQTGFVTVDAGLKSMATDAGAPRVVGHDSTIEFHFFGDEQGLVTNGADGPLRRGERLELVPPHCDPTVDRYDVIWLTRDDVVIGFADVDARGCSQ